MDRLGSIANVKSKIKGLALLRLLANADVLWIKADKGGRYPSHWLTPAVGRTVPLSHLLLLIWYVMASHGIDGNSRYLFQRDHRAISILTSWNTQSKALWELCAEVYLSVCLFVKAYQEWMGSPDDLTWFDLTPNFRYRPVELLFIHGTGRISHPALASYLHCILGFCGISDVAIT